MLYVYPRSSIYSFSVEVHSDLIPPLNHQRRNFFRDRLSRLPTVVIGWTYHDHVSHRRHFLYVVRLGLPLPHAARASDQLWAPRPTPPYPDWPRVGIPAQTAAGFFGAVNVFLFVVPLTKPPVGADPHTSLPYWAHAVAGWAVFGLGFLYWVFLAQILPRLGKYKLYRVG